MVRMVVVDVIGCRRGGSRTAPTGCVGDDDNAMPMIGYNDPFIQIARFLIKYCVYTALFNLVL
jgi:hypothetical protein